MSGVYKLTQKSVWTNDVGRHTSWYLLDERKKGYYIDHVKWSRELDWSFLIPDSIPEQECMAFRYNGKKNEVTSWAELDAVYGMGPHESFKAICKHLKIKVRYL